MGKGVLENIYAPLQWIFSLLF